METAINETNRRREIQERYNEEHGIVPKTIVKEVRDVIEISAKSDKKGKQKKQLSREEKQLLIKQYTSLMREAAKVLDFEQAAYFRDKITELKDK